MDSNSASDEITSSSIDPRGDKQPTAEFYDKKADLILYSSDDYPFMIYKYELQFIRQVIDFYTDQQANVNSPIFRDMLTETRSEADGHGRAIVRLVDPDIEDSKTVTAFMKLLRSTSVDKLHDRDLSWEGDYKTFQFALKYDCSHVIYVLVASLNHRLLMPSLFTSATQFCVAFVMAARLDDHTTCCKILSESCNWKAKPGNTPSLAPAETPLDETVFQTAEHAYPAIRLLSPPYAWAFASAFSIGPPVDNVWGKASRVGSRFYSLLNRARSSEESVCSSFRTR